MSGFPLAEPSGVAQTTLVVLVVVVGLLVAGTVVLAAFALVVRALHTKRERSMQRLSNRWLEPVLGSIADPTLVPSVQAQVGEKEHLPFLEFVIEYARRLRGTGHGVLCELARPFLPSITERVRSRRTEMRAWAVQVLGTLGLPEHEDAVLEALDDPSPLVAMVAARALARRGTPQYAPAVLDRLDRFDEWNRIFLASMLAAMGPDVSPELRAGLADASVAPATRAVMAEALLVQGDFQAGDVAAEVVSSVPDRNLLYSALRLLAAVGRPEHIDVVRPLARSEDPVVRAQALRAMGPLGTRGDVPLLIEAMKDPNPWQALYAARGAREAGGRDVLAGLVASGDARSALAEQVLLEDGPG